MSSKLHQQQQGGFLQQLLQQFSQSEVKKLQQQQQQQQQQQGGVKNKKSKSVKTKRGGGGDEPLNESERRQLELYEEQRQLEEASRTAMIRREDEKWKKWEENKEAVLEKQEQNQINYDGHNPYGGQFAGNVKVYTGPKQGKFIINKKGKKVYIDRKTLNNNVPYLKKKAKKGKAKVAK
jgi:hypothetical protein